MKRILLALAVGFAGACTQQAPQSEDFPVVEAPNYDASIGPDGAAGIRTALPINVDAIASAAPNYVVTSVEDQVEGQVFTAITLSAGDEEVFRINPTGDGRNIHSIVTRSTQAHGPRDEIIGRVTYADALPEDVAFCSEDHSGSGEFACSTAEDGRFWRVYEGGDIRRPDARLVEMRWVAPRVAP